MWLPGKGINLSKKKLDALDAAVWSLVNQGQSPYMIVASLPELGVSVNTLYKYIHQGVLLTKDVDLKRKVKFKSRKIHNSQIKNREV